MKTKAVTPAEDPETKARREVEEARAEADQSAALRGLVSERTRRVLRVFGSRPGSSGGSGLVVRAGGPAVSRGGGGAGVSAPAGGFGGFGGGDYGGAGFGTEYRQVF